MHLEDIMLGQVCSYRHICAESVSNHQEIKVLGMVAKAAPKNVAVEVLYCLAGR